MRRDEMRMEPWNNYFNRYTVFMVRGRYSVGRMGINVEYNRVMAVVTGGAGICVSDMHRNVVQQC